MRHTFKLILIFLLISLAGNNAFSQKTTCREEKVGKTWYSICEDNIVTEKKKVIITTKSVAKKVGNKNTVKIVHFYNQNRKSNETDEIFLLYGKFINNLEKLDVVINGKEFTGVLKIAVPFYNDGVSANYSGYDILTYEFKEGKFFSKSRANDVDLEKEKPLVRPT